MQAVVLAGGLGTRLRGALPDGLPKPMAPVAGRPFLEHVLERLLAEGIDHLVLLLGYASSVITTHFGDAYGGVPIEYAIEEEPLGTGGALRHARSLLADEFILLNGDTWVETSCRALTGLLTDSTLAMALTEVPDSGRFGRARVRDGRVIGLAEKASSGAGLINAGVYGCRSELVERFPAGCRLSFEQDVLQPLLPRLRPPYTLTGSTFFDIGVPVDYSAADAYLRAHAQGK